MRRGALPGALAALLIVGCGSGSLSSSDLRRQATQICQSARSASNRIPAPRGPAGGATFLRRGIAVLKPELSRLRTLHASGGSASVYSTALGAFSEKLRLLQEAVGALDAGADPVSTFKNLQQQLQPLEGRENEAWRSLEIPACEQ